MFGSSPGVPYWHQATASSPSKTSAACSIPSRTRRSFHGRPFSPSGLPSREWNQVHQQPPNPMPLCFSARRSNASHVDASSGLIVYALMHPPSRRRIAPHATSSYETARRDDLTAPGFCRSYVQGVRISLLGPGEVSDWVLGDRLRRVPVAAFRLRGHCSESTRVLEPGLFL